MTAAEAYAEVERLTRRRARNFAYGIMVLPKPKRQAIAAIYAFAREVDDVADGPLPPEEKRRRLEALGSALDEPPGDDATLVALADSRRRYPIPRRALEDLVAGGLQDLERTRYATFDELRGYCRLVAGAVGVAIERGIIRFLYGRPLETLLATWGLSLVIQQAVRTAFGPTNREVGNPSWMSGAFELGQITITYNRLWILCFTLAVFVILLAMLRYTALGLEMRAVTQNRRMAASMGIATSRVDALTFGLGSGIAGIAGVALSQIDNVSPNLGQNYIIDSFMVVVFGGVGNLWGTLVGAFTLGIANKFLEPVAGAVLGKIAILVLIILFIQKRPRGLFALKGRAVEA